MGILKLKDNRIGKLSGGKQKRVFLSKYLYNPKLLMFDEPTTGIA